MGRSPPDIKPAVFSSYLLATTYLRQTEESLYLRLYLFITEVPLVKRAGGTGSDARPAASLLIPIAL
jgi:hypothetical protein